LAFLEGVPVAFVVVLVVGRTSGEECELDVVVKLGGVWYSLLVLDVVAVESSEVDVSAGVDTDDGEEPTDAEALPLLEPF